MKNAALEVYLGAENVAGFALAAGTKDNLGKEVIHS